MGMRAASAYIFKAGLTATLTPKYRKDPELQQKLQWTMDFIAPSQAH